MPDSVSVRIKPPGRPWSTLHADPQSPELSSNRWGPDEARLDVLRDPRIPWDDLGPFAPVEIDIAGVPVWSGRIINTPTNGRVITINAQGWQYRLDDFPIRALYCHTRISDWRDWRTNLLANLAFYTSGWSIESSGTLTLRNTGAAGAAPPRAAAYLDLGFADAAKRVVITWEKNGVWAGTGSARLLYSNADDVSAGTAGTIIALTSATNSGTYTANVSGRYVMVQIFNDTAQADDNYFRITSVQVFGDTAWESGNASVLKAEDVIQDAIAAGAADLAADFSLIGTTATAIPALDSLEYATPRELCTRANDLHDQILRVGVDKRVTLKDRPTGPLFHVGAWSDYEFSDPSANNGEALFTDVAVTGTQANGNGLAVEDSQSLPLLEGTSTERRHVIQVDAPLTTPIATKFTSTFLDGHRTSRLQGTLTVSGERAIRGPAGERVHPSLLLRNAQELVRIGDQINPDTGAVGRDGMIASVRYSHADRSASIELDNERRDWDAQLARYNLLAGAVAGG